MPRPWTRAQPLGLDPGLVLCGHELAMVGPIDICFIHKCWGLGVVGQGVVGWVGEPLWPAVVASGGSKSSTIEGLGNFKPLWRTVVASGGSKSATIEGLRFFKSLWRTVVASGGSKSSII